jgi:hypothetical protein
MNVGERIMLLKEKKLFVKKGNELEKKNCKEKIVITHTTKENQKKDRNKD